MGKDTSVSARSKPTWNDFLTALEKRSDLVDATHVVRHCLVLRYLYIEERRALHELVCNVTLRSLSYAYPYVPAGDRGNAFTSKVFRL